MIADVHDGAHTPLPTIELGGKRWAANPPALLAAYYSYEPIARPVNFLACIDCKQICLTRVDCPCCWKVGKTFGGKRVRLSGAHDRFPVAEVLDALRKLQ